jgi:hypothetical protein
MYVLIIVSVHIFANLFVIFLFYLKFLLNFSIPSVLIHKISYSRLQSFRYSYLNYETGLVVLLSSLLFPS